MLSSATVIIITPCTAFWVTMHHKMFAGDVLTEEEVMMLINAADKDGDGSLDFEEFVKIMMWIFWKVKKVFVKYQNLWIFLKVKKSICEMSILKWGWPMQPIDEKSDVDFASTWSDADLREFIKIIKSELFKWVLTSNLGMKKPANISKTIDKDTKNGSLNIQSWVAVYICWTVSEVPKVPIFSNFHIFCDISHLYEGRCILE